MRARTDPIYISGAEDPRFTPKRLAITISGAVSLGSYEAGVLYEVVNAIGQHNSQPETKPEERIEIDVLTGASAGGMTATIAAQKLMFEAGALRGAFTNSFDIPWVADVSLDGLLNMHGDDDRMKSILSSEHVIDISKRHLTARYLNHVDPPRERHPAGAKRSARGEKFSRKFRLHGSRRKLSRDWAAADQRDLRPGPLPGLGLRGENKCQHRSL
jgi:hypothetical protein